MTFHTDTAAPGPPPSNYAAQWKKIDALLDKDQPATAAPLVEAIYQEAKKRQDAPAYVRALLYKVQLLERKHDDADEKSIALLEADLQTADFPARPILHSLLGGLYTEYLNQNRYRLYQRTAGAEATTDAAAPNGDAAADGGTSLATWDMARLGATIVQHYQRSVQDEPQRQLQTRLAALGDLVAGGDAEGRALRPTLYDLLAHRAIEGLQNQELYVTKPEQQFQLTEPKLFGPAAEFAALKLTAPVADSLNGQFLALRLLQQLTALRLEEAKKDAAQRPALADVDLQRIDYLKSATEDGDLTEEYEPALARLAQEYAGEAIGAEFMARRAAWLHENEAPVAAVALAQTIEQRYPKSRGAQRARRLRAGIEQPELALAAADVVVPGQPWRLDLTLRNVTGLYAQAYPISLKEWQEMENHGTDQRDKDQARIVRRKPAASWAPALPAHPQDYREQKLAVAGAALPVGYYLILVSNQADKLLSKRPGLVTSFGLLGVSELSAVSRRSPDSNETSLLVLQRQSGASLAGVRAQATYERYDYKARKSIVRTAEAGPSAADGEMKLPAAQENERLSQVRLWRGADTLALDAVGNYYRPSRPAAEIPERRTFLFTDRAIYRPGQTLYFKGILTESLAGKARLLPGQPVSVQLQDVNGQTVQTLTFTTSDFGSFHGSLVLPTGLLNGQMSLQTNDGSVEFAVEDYKRPTFEVTLAPVAGQPRLGEPLTVSGQARAYAGQATDGATVSYRVVRRELWPLFGFGFEYGRGGHSSGGQEIAHGSTTTDAEGRFNVSFTPPRGPKTKAGKRRRYEPGYLFEITADVTDAAGETRTGTRSVAIGHNPLSLNMTGPALADKQQRPAFYLFSANATGESLPAAGSLRILSRRYRPNPPGVAGPAPETTENEAPPELIKTLAFDTKNGPALDLKATLAALPTGRYRLEAQAAGADSARARHDFTLYDSEAATVPFATPDWFVTLADSVAPGSPATVLLGSSEASAHVLLEVERGGQLLRREWLTLAAGEQRRLRLESGPATALGPLYVHTTQVRDNQLYRHDAAVQVIEKPQPLRLDISTFRDKLQPGQRETWRVTIHQADGKAADAELLATLYDQSLDVFRPHGLVGLSFGGRYYPALFAWSGQFGQMRGGALFWPEYVGMSGVSYPVLNTWFGRGNVAGYGGGRGVGAVRRMSLSAPGMANGEVAADMAMAAPAMAPAPEASKKMLAEVVVSPPPPPPPPGAAPNLAAIAARSDFRETALWEPALRTDKNGDVVLEFQMPEAVTRWQLLALAHDQQLHSGQLARQLVTQKEIQLTPNAPRFFRQGDTFTFPAKFSNLSDGPVSGTAQLFLLDAATGQDITGQLLKGPAQQSVSAPGKQSVALGWEISLPADFAPVAVTYKVVAQVSSDAQGQTSATKPRKPSTRHQAPSTNTYSDGEENTLPVLPNRLLITESLPLPIVGPATRDFELKKLSSTSSPTRRNYSLTLEMTSNPAWYAVQSLPYLLEYPYECSEQVFSRLYANLLAAQILKSNPRFKTVLAEWQRQAQNGTAAQKNAIASKLEQNQELKSLLLQETPWVRDAQDENERLARLSTLFDETRLKAETSRALLRLQKQQLPDGSFPWFEQMPTDRYITQLIVAGFGKLQRLGAFDATKDEVAQGILQNALRYLDATLTRDYDELRKQKGVKLTDDHLGDLETQALYARSFWPQPVPAAAKAAYAYYRGQGAKYWPSRSRYLQAQLALLLFRDDKAAPAAPQILRALAENALHSPELGMYWKEVRGGYYWRDAPTETQATLIEAFHELKQDEKSVDEMKLWLLKQKQTQSWESTRATADACYALLLRGSDWLTPSQPLQITVGGAAVKPAATQAGTGYFKTTWPAAEVQPAQGQVRIQKPDAGVAWGALYWQYFEDIDKVTSAATPLSLERELYRETRTAAGPQLEKLTAATPLKVGDALVVRLVLRTDRALEYVHLKDQRAAGLEPIGQLSGYRYQNGLGYYESPRDAATNFFLGSVPRGTHVFEYRLRASQAGDFSGGLSQVQCLYAPEFGAHSAGIRLTIARP